MEVDHIHDVREPEEPVAGARREVAYCDLLGFRVLLTKCSDVLYVLVLPSAVHLDHNFAVDYNMVDQKVVVDVQRKKAQQEEDVMMKGRALDSRREEKGFVHMVMRYSARRDVAAVLGP